MKNQIAIGLVILMSGGVLLGMHGGGYNVQKAIKAYSDVLYQEKNEEVKEETTTLDELETMTEKNTQEKTTQEQQVKEDVPENIEQESTSAKNSDNADKKDNSLIAKTDFEGTDLINMFGKQKAVADTDKIEQIEDLLCTLDLKPLNESDAKAVQKKIEDIYGISLFLSFKDGKDKVLKEINLLPYIENDGYYLKIDDKTYKVTNEKQDVNTIKDSISKIFDELK